MHFGTGGDLTTKVRKAEGGIRSLRPWRDQLSDPALKNLGEVQEFKVPDPPGAPLDLGDRVAVDVPTNPLASRSQSGLRQPSLGAEPPDLRADDVFVVGLHRAGFST